jgi:hypothetical protein
MKTIKLITVGILLFAGIVACKKTVPEDTVYMDASKTSAIKKGEPVLFTLAQAPASSTVNWSVSPNTNTQINPSGNQAAIRFGSRGNYTVTAVAGNISASRLVTVSDSTYADTTSGGGGGGGGTPPTILPFSSGETIRISVSRADSGTSYGLIFSARTTNSYTCINNYMLSTFTSGASSYNIGYTGVSVPGGCATGSATAGSFAYLFPMANGSNTLTINFNGNTYTGTIVKSGINFTINWNYSTGVVISPTSL